MTTSTGKQEARAAIRAIDRARRLRIQLSEAESDVRAHGRRMYDLNGLYGGINEARVYEMAMQRVGR